MENSWGAGYCCVTNSYKFSSKSPKRPEAPNLNNSGLSQSLPSISLISTNHANASFAFRTPPAGFKPT